MRFKPSIGLTFALLIIGLLFLRLGFWQLVRGAEKEQLFEQFNQAPLTAIESALEQDEGFWRVEAYGEFDPDRHILLDNKIFQGRPGVHVLTPFALDSGQIFLVNRGWLPMPPDRRNLPLVTGSPGKHLISGLLKKPTTGGQRLGDPDDLSGQDWPQLVTYFDLDSIASALGTPLAPWLLQLDEDHPAGFQDRQWEAAVMTPEVHRAYALQWFALSLATLIIWVTLGIRRGQQLAAKETS